MTLNFRNLSTIWTTCLVTLFASEYISVIDQFGKMLLLLIGLIAGVMMLKTAQIKLIQAKKEAEIFKLKEIHDKLIEDQMAEDAVRNYEMNRDATKNKILRQAKKDHERLHN